MITFGAPWLLLLLLVPLLLRRILPQHREERDAVYAPFAADLADLSGQEMQQGAVTVRRSFVQAALFVVTWILVVAALARPQWIGEPIERTVPMRDLLLAVDLSGSMGTEDFTDSTGATVDRLTAVKQVLADFLEQREGDRVGLIFFGSAAFVQAPFTEDLAVCNQLLQEAQVRMAGPKTTVGEAIGLAVTTFESSDVEDRVLMLLTDGNDTGSRVPPDRAADVAKDRGITIHTIAVGDPRAVGEEKLDEETLKEISTKTGGVYAHASDRAELVTVYERLDEIETRNVETLSYRPRRDLFQWPLAALVLISLAFHAFMAIPASLRLRRVRQTSEAHV